MSDQQEMTKDLLDVVERMRLGKVLYRDPDLVIKASARIVDLEQENKILRLKSNASLANNLCPDHRDTQKGKPCLACEIDRLRARIAELDRRLEISPLHSVDGIAARDETIRLQQARIAELEQENFALAAGACIVDGGLVGGEGGSPVCTLRERIAELGHLVALLSCYEGNATGMHMAFLRWRAQQEATKP